MEYSDIVFLSDGSSLYEGNTLFYFNDGSLDVISLFSYVIFFKSSVAQGA